MSITEIVIAVFGSLTTVSAYIFARRKTRAEALDIEVRSKTTEIENDIRISDYYKVLLDDLTDRYEKKYKELVTLYENKEKVLKEEIALLRRQNTDLKKQNNELRKRLKEAGA